MHRRAVVTLIAGVASWPLAVRAQQIATPVIGYLTSYSPDTRDKFTRAFLQGLSEVALVEGKDFKVEYSLAEPGHYDRLPAMATHLIGRGVSVLFASPISAAIAAKAATSITPIVFAIGSDPVKMRLVSTLNRPGGNATGATFLSVELGRKRLELLRDLVPKMVSVALLVNPKNPTTADQTKDFQMAANALGLQSHVVDISPTTDIENVFSTLVHQKTGALVVSADSIFWEIRDKLIESAARLSLPTIYFAREFALAGGLASYNSDYADSIRKAGIYVGRILKGEKPTDLPVLQPTKFDLVINLKTAKALSLTVPPTLIVSADKLIE